MSNTPTSSVSDFIVDDCFVDDDLLTSDDINSARVFKQQMQTQKSFLERDNFETELGTTNEDPFGEDFADISRYEIIDVFAEGDMVARPIIVFYAYRLPSNKSFDHYKFLRFIQFTLDKIVDMDYTLIYFHYGLRSNNKPPLKWLISTYKLLDRRYKKNLKALYLVHPTKFIRFLWRIFRPIISLKFEQKIHYMNSLDELNAVLPLANLNLPQPILDFDKSSANRSSSTLNGYASPVASFSPRPTQQFNVPLKFILDHHPNSDIPPIAAELMDFLRSYGLKYEGIFRRSAPINTIKALQGRINLGEKIDFMNDPEFNGNIENAILCASVLLKTFLRSMGEPVLTNSLYSELTLLTGVQKSDRFDAIRELLRKLPLENYLLLKRVILFLTEVAEHSADNLMDANNLGVIFGPNLTWPTDQQVPMSQLNNLNSFCYTLIKQYDVIFIDNY